METIKQKNNTLHIMLLMFVFFAFISPLSELLFVVLCAFVVAAPFIFDDERLFCFWIFAACFMSCFRFQTVFLAVLDASMFVFILKHVIFELKNHRRPTFIYYLLGAFIVCFCYSACVSGNAYKLTQSLGIVLSIASLFIVKNLSLKKVTLYLIFGLIISSIISLIAYVSGIFWISPLFTDATSSIRFGAYFCNVNALALYCGFAQSCILTLMLSSKVDFKKWIWLLITITIIGLLTFSKTFIIITAFIYALSILIGFIISKNKKQYIKFILILLISLIVLVLIFNKYVDTIIKRFYVQPEYSGTLNAMTTGRLDIWKLYLKKWSSSPLTVLFGCGITAPNINDRTPHSFYISLIYKFGIVGILALCVAVIYILRKHKLNKSAFWYIPLITLLLNGIAEDLACSLYTCLPLVISFIFITKTKNID